MQRRGRGDMSVEAILARHGEQRLDPEEFERGRHSFLVNKVRQFVEPYLGYLRCQLTFDTANARAALEGTGVEFPETDYQFLTRILQYAVDKKYLIA